MVALGSDERSYSSLSHCVIGSEGQEPGQPCCDGVVPLLDGRAGGALFLYDCDANALVAKTTVPTSLLAAVNETSPFELNSAQCRATLVDQNNCMDGHALLSTLQLLPSGQSVWFLWRMQMLPERPFEEPAVHYSATNAQGQVQVDTIPVHALSSSLPCIRQSSSALSAPIRHLFISSSARRYALSPRVSASGAYAFMLARRHTRSGKALTFVATRDLRLTDPHDQEWCTAQPGDGAESDQEFHNFSLDRRRPAHRQYPLESQQKDGGVWLYALDPVTCLSTAPRAADGELRPLSLLPLDDGRQLWLDVGHKALCRLVVGNVDDSLV